MSLKKLKEKYLTVRNINKKSKEWLGKLYCSAQKIAKFNKSVNFAKSALLVIDMQNCFVDDKYHSHVPSAKAIIPNIKKIIKLCKEKCIPIIFTRYALDKKDNGMMVKWWGDKFFDGTKETEIIDELKKDGGDHIIIRKKQYSAFYQTVLNQILKKQNVKTVIITGVMTNLCCETTARDAFMHNFNVYFVIDAAAAFNEDLHLSSLKTLSHGFAIPIRTDDLTGDLIEPL